LDLISFSSLCDEFEDIFSTTFFIEGFLGVFGLCFSSLNLILVVSLNGNSRNNLLTFSFIKDDIDASNFMIYLIHACFILQQIFMCSYLGSQIESNSAATLDAIYETDWISADKETKKLCLIAMENMKKPIKLRALSIFGVNLQSFLFIIKTTYSMIALFRSLEI